MKRKELFWGIFASAGMLALIFDSRTALSGAQQGIDICLKTVIPSLFPFFILSAFLTGTFAGVSPSFLRPIGRLTGVPPGAESILVSGFLGGYPVGARSISQAYHAGQLKKEAAEHLLAFCSNAGPAFLFGMVGTMFPQKWQAWILWGIHIASALMVGTIFAENRPPVPSPEPMVFSLNNILNSAVQAMAAVCSWVILFRIIIAFLERWIFWFFPREAQILLIGLLELSNGCCELDQISDISVRFITCSGILAFGGLCVTMQTVSVVKGLSLRCYVRGKILQTMFSLILSSAVAYGVWPIFCILAAFFLIIPMIKQKKSSIHAPLGV